MLIVGCINGYFAFKFRDKTSDLVQATLKEQDIPHKQLVMKSLFMKQRSRKMRKFILENSSPKNNLLLVGKSLGAHNLIKRVLPNIEKENPLLYKKITLLTIDPCWPIAKDVTPNLNNQMLKLTAPIDLSINIFLKTPDKREQSGSRVYIFSSRRDKNITRNIPISKLDNPSITHFNIIEHPLVSSSILECIQFSSY